MNKEYRGKVMDSVKDLLKEMESKIDEREFAIRYNLKDVIEALLWGLVLEYTNKPNDIYNYEENRTALELDLETIIDEVFKTTFQKGPEGETYPSFNKTKVFKEAYVRISKVLKIKGIVSQKIK